MLVIKVSNQGIHGFFIDKYWSRVRTLRWSINSSDPAIGAALSPTFTLAAIFAITQTPIFGE